METAVMNYSVQQIGEVAGAVWHVLNEGGPLTLTKWVERVGENRDMVMQAVGWLAREGKIELSENKRQKLVSLRD